MLSSDRAARSSGESSPSKASTVRSFLSMGWSALDKFLLLPLRHQVVPAFCQQLFGVAYHRVPLLPVLRQELLHQSVGLLLALSAEPDPFRAFMVDTLDVLVVPREMEAVEVVDGTDVGPPAQAPLFFDRVPPSCESGEN